MILISKTKLGMTDQYVLLLYKQHLVSLPFNLSSHFRTIEGAEFSAQWRVGEIRPKVNMVKYFF